MSRFQQFGLTLTELSVVICVVGIIAATSISIFRGLTEQADANLVKIAQAQTQSTLSIACTNRNRSPRVVMSNGAGNTCPDCATGIGDRQRIVNIVQRALGGNQNFNCQDAFNCTLVFPASNRQANYTITAGGTVNLQNIPGFQNYRIL
ncbi:MAG: prepilin-type N-terminal cleavage/methylation domain-containing protein, partial [Cyanobacteria bacterium]|nr:prepilin-type N-terminal cleavage/methylation domain-containing protein [Cyanobacteriota bacterium]